MTSESTGSGITLGDLTARATSLLDANTILALIRPAFEAKEREIDLLAKQRDTFRRARNLAEAKLAQAVEALAAVQPYLGAIVCYASTLDEHDGNRVAKLVTSASAAARGEA